jgi:hypothetical protein
MEVLVVFYAGVIILALYMGFKGLRLRDQIPEPLRSKLVKPPAKDDGWLYFIGNGAGPIKVGVTRDTPRERLKALQTGNPTRLRVLFAIEAEDVLAAEKLAHNALTPAHVQGEWYEREAVLLFIDLLKNEKEKTMPSNVVPIRPDDPF